MKVTVDQLRALVRQQLQEKDINSGYNMKEERGEYVPRSPAPKPDVELIEKIAELMASEPEFKMLSRYSDQFKQKAGSNPESALEAILPDYVSGGVIRKVIDAAKESLGRPAEPMKRPTDPPIGGESDYLDENSVGGINSVRVTIDQLKGFIRQQLEEYGDHETQAAGGETESSRNQGGWNQDPEMDQVQDIALTVVEQGGQLMQIANALKDEAFDARVLSGVLVVGDKYFIGKPSKFDIDPAEDFREIGPYVLGYQHTQNPMQEDSGDSMIAKATAIFPEAEVYEDDMGGFEIVLSPESIARLESDPQLQGQLSDAFGDTWEMTEDGIAVGAKFMQEAMGGFDVSQIQSREDKKYGGTIYMLPDIQFTGDHVADVENMPGELLTWLYGELESGDSIQDSAGRVYAGADIQDVVGGLPDEMFAEGKLSDEDREFHKSVMDKGKVPNLKGDMGPLPGLEGPFQFRSGAVLYYDPKEGEFYDRGKDMYIDREEIASLTMEALPAPANKTIKISLNTIRDMVRSHMQEGAASMFEKGDQVNDIRNDKAYKVTEVRADGAVMVVDENGEAAIIKADHLKKVEGTPKIDEGYREGAMQAEEIIRSLHGKGNSHMDILMMLAQEIPEAISSRSIYMSLPLS